ncbi:MAG: hypothetical protein K1X79_08425 [Oligoflexia bacterium]|nr:hypothetical protein [Oligoflexia bacterium]
MRSFLRAYFASLQTRANRAFSPHMLSVRLRPVVDELIMPLRLLKMGHVVLLPYVALLLFAAWRGYAEAVVYLRESIRVALRDLAPSQTLSKSLDIITSVSIGYFCFCLALVALILPVRIVWLKGRMAIGMSISETVPSFLYAARTLAKALHLALYRLIPGIAMLLVWIFFAGNLRQHNVQLLFGLACCLVIPHNIWRTYTFLLSPIVAICGQIQPALRALSASETALRQHGFELVSVIITTLGALVAINLALHKHIVTAVARLPNWELAIYGAILWYGITLLAFLIMRALSRLN